MGFAVTNFDSLSAVIQVAGFVIPIGVGAFSMWHKIEKRQSAFDVQVTRIDEKLSNIEKQFGNNGGGMREAINRIGTTVDSIGGRVDQISTDVAELSGRFDQHIIETN